MKCVSVGEFDVTVKLDDFGDFDADDDILVQVTVTQQNPGGTSIADAFKVVTLGAAPLRAIVRATHRTGTPGFVTGYGVVATTQASYVWASALTPAEPPTGTTQAPNEPVPQNFTWVLPDPPTSGSAASS